MRTSLLCLACAALSMLAAPAAARLQAAPIHATEFAVNGLDLLEGRYGVAYPGFESASHGTRGVRTQTIVQQPILQQQQYDYAGAGLQQPILQQQQTILQQPLMQQQPWMQQQQPIGQQDLGLGLGAGMQYGMGAEYGMGVQNAQYGQQTDYAGAALQQSYGAVAASDLGAQQTVLSQVSSNNFAGVMAAAAGSTKGVTSYAAPIYAASIINPKIITQPIYRTHSITQPILQQRYIQQPIVETRQVIQPVIRRIITQPILRPTIYDSTTIQPTLKQETIVQPHLIQQTVVTPQLQTVNSENQPMIEAATLNTAAPVTLPTTSAKASSAGLSLFAGLGIQ